MMWMLLACLAHAGDAALTASVVVKVPQPEASAERLVDAIEAAGGWFTERTQQGLVLRVPTDEVDGLLAAVAKEGRLVERELERRDVSSRIDDLRSEIASRQGILDDYFELIATADTASVLTVEREILHIVGELEELRGALRMVEHDAAHARVAVSFRFPDRRAPVPDGNSAFEWLNSLDLITLVTDFEYGWSAWGPRLRLAAEAPEGLSAYRGRRELKAVSPDGVLYRVRAARHRPSADLAFWEEALETRMASAGYRVVSTERVQSDSLGEGAVIELGAPLGPDDATYIVGVFVDGRRLILVEAAGEVSRVEARREALLTAVRSL